MPFSGNRADQRTEVTYEGDLTISDNATFIIENLEFRMIGKITVKDASTLIIRDSNFTSIALYGKSIVVEGRANLIVNCATIVFKPRGSPYGEIVVRDNAFRAEGGVRWSLQQLGDLH